MPKTTVASWDTTAGNNADLNSINIGEGWASADMNNAIRELMAQLATEHARKRGCRVVTSTAQNINYNSATAVQFASASETFDALGFFTEGTSNTSFTVPAGVTYIRVWAQIALAATGAATAPIILEARLDNVAFATSSTLSASGFGCYAQIESGVFPVAAGNVITIHVTQLTDNPGPLATTSARINIEVVQ